MTKDALDKLILKQWTGWVILSKRDCPVGISVDMKGMRSEYKYRTGFIEVFKTRKTAKYYLQEGEKIIKVMVREKVRE